jgi:hypothetical protein
VVGGRFDLYVCDETLYCLDLTIVTRHVVGEWVRRFAHFEARAHVLCGL